MSNAYRSSLAGGGAAIGDATAADVLTGKTFSGAVGSGVAGTMPNNGAVSETLTVGQTYTVPAGYHNGNGTVTAPSTVINPQIITKVDNETLPVTEGKTYFVSKVSSSQPTISGGTVLLSTTVVPSATTVFQWVIVATSTTISVTGGSSTGDLGCVQLD